eukprot:9648955-Lingulodinium_polyedra.AAC.1
MANPPVYKNLRYLEAATLPLVLQHCTFESDGNVTTLEEPMDLETIFAAIPASAPAPVRRKKRT